MSGSLPPPPRRFGLNEPTAGLAARASWHASLLSSALVLALPVAWVAVVSVRSCILWCDGGGCRSVSQTMGAVSVASQLLSLVSLLIAQELGRGCCEYEPTRDFMERYAGFLFLYRGRAQILILLAVLCLGSSDFHRGGVLLYGPIVACIACLLAAVLAFHVSRHEPELDQEMTWRLEQATEKRLEWDAAALSRRFDDEDESPQARRAGRGKWGLPSDVQPRTGRGQWGLESSASADSDGGDSNSSGGGDRVSAAAGGARHVRTGTVSAPARPFGNEPRLSGLVGRDSVVADELPSDFLVGGGGSSGEGNERSI